MYIPSTIIYLNYHDGCKAPQTRKGLSYLFFFLSIIYLPPCRIYNSQLSLQVTIIFPIGNNPSPCVCRFPCTPLVMVGIEKSKWRKISKYTYLLYAYNLTPNPAVIKMPCLSRFYLSQKI